MKDVLCISCAHLEVCKHVDSFLAMHKKMEAIGTTEHLTVHVTCQKYIWMGLCHEGLRSYVRVLLTST